MHKKFMNAALAASLSIGAMISGQIANAETTKEKILRTHTVTIGIHNRVPWGYRDASGDVSGLEPDIIRAALAPLGVTDVEFVIGEFSTMIPGLLAGRFDMTAAGVAIKPERCKAVIFSEPDLTSGDGIIVAKGNPKNLHSFQDIIADPSVTLAGVRGSANTEHAVMAGVPDAQLVLFQDNISAVSAVTAGRVDAAIMSAATAIATLSQNDMPTVERAEPFELLKDENGEEVALYTAVAFRPSDADLRDLYNESLEKLKKDGTLHSIILDNGFTEENFPPRKTAASLCGDEG